jgi:DnaJ-class molecular chaperone
MTSPTPAGEKDWDQVEADAYGRTGERSNCSTCRGKGTDYDETCLECGGYGWVRADENYANRIRSLKSTTRGEPGNG